MPKYTVESPFSASALEALLGTTAKVTRVPVKFFHTSSAAGAMVVADNYPRSTPDKQGAELYVEAASEASGASPEGWLNSRDSRSLSMPRADVERLHAWLGEWLGA